MKKIMCVAFLTAAVGIVASTSLAASDTIKASDYGEDWPFRPYSSGTLTCEGSSYVLIILDGDRYALNGSARGAGIYADTFDIMPRAENGAFRGGIPMVVSKLIKLGLELCN